MIDISIEHNHTIGIYLIQNIITNQVYIGSSKNIYRRIILHKSLLRNHKHHNKYLQNSFNKYHEHNFIVIILSECNESELSSKEEYIIKLYKAKDRIFGYNSRSICTSNIGFKHSDITKQKISKSKKGKLKTIDQKIMYQNVHINLKGKPVLKYSLCNRFIHEYKGIRLAARENNMSYQSIQACCKGKTKSAGGFVWRYKFGPKNI